MLKKIQSGVYYMSLVSIFTQEVIARPFVHGGCQNPYCLVLDYEETKIFSLAECPGCSSPVRVQMFYQEFDVQELMARDPSVRAVKVKFGKGGSKTVVKSFRFEQADRIYISKAARAVAYLSHIAPEAVGKQCIIKEAAALNVDREVARNEFIWCRLLNSAEEVDGVGLNCNQHFVRLKFAGSATLPVNTVVVHVGRGRFLALPPCAEFFYFNLAEAYLRGEIVLKQTRMRFAGRRSLPSYAYDFKQQLLFLVGGLEFINDKELPSASTQYIDCEYDNPQNWRLEKGGVLGQGEVGGTLVVTNSKFYLVGSRKNILKKTTLLLQLGVKKNSSKLEAFRAGKWLAMASELKATATIFPLVFEVPAPSQKKLPLLFVLPGGLSLGGDYFSRRSELEVGIRCLIHNMQTSEGRYVAYRFDKDKLVVSDSLGLLRDNGWLVVADGVVRFLETNPRSRDSAILFQLHYKGEPKMLAKTVSF